ncbi:hypothetical protein E2C01_062317 [Portunus trituberculatus]|uniref:Uncharacterized protein n=1 Tax=Portunus trituberculatus TaxID=210409 RepID=A0A5B7HAL4_PORTR|nr:hypothetical protein [Portunus trituberculatus]
MAPPGKHTNTWRVRERQELKPRGTLKDTSWTTRHQTDTPPHHKLLSAPWASLSPLGQTQRQGNIPVKQPTPLNSITCNRTTSLENSTCAGGIEKAVTITRKKCVSFRISCHLLCRELIPGARPRVSFNLGIVRTFTGCSRCSG